MDTNKQKIRLRQTILFVSVSFFLGLALFIFSYIINPAQSPWTQSFWSGFIKDIGYTFASTTIIALLFSYFAETRGNKELAEDIIETLRKEFGLKSLSRQENQDIYLSVCLFRDGETDEQKERNKKTLDFYRNLLKTLEVVVQKSGRKVVTRRDFYKDDVINPGKMPDYANEAFAKIARCKYFIAVIQKMTDAEYAGAGSHLIEVGYALAKGLPVLCYIERGMYVPKFLREVNLLSQYKLIPYSNMDELFIRLEAVDTDFKSIEPKSIEPI